MLDGIDDDLYSICFMTTNYYDQLVGTTVGQQLFRSGRLDFSREFYNAEPVQVKQMFLWFYRPGWYPDVLSNTCGVNCELNHTDDGPCLVCYQPWVGQHNGHTCVVSQSRGRWSLGARELKPRSLQVQEQDFLDTFDRVLTAITPESTAQPQPLQPQDEHNKRNRRDLFQVRCDRLKALKALVMKEAFGKVQNDATGTFESRAGWAPKPETPSWLKVLAYAASRHFESEHMLRRYHVSDVQAYFQCMLFQKHRCAMQCKAPHCALQIKRFPALSGTWTIPSSSPWRCLALRSSSRTQARAWNP